MPVKAGNCQIKSELVHLNGNDHIHFADGINESQVTLRKDTNNNLIIRINNTDSITITGMFNAQGALTASAIEEIHFGNAVVWNASVLPPSLPVTSPMYLPEPRQMTF